MNQKTRFAFELQEQRFIPALAATAREYRHLRTGARHLHLATNEPELGFLVAFPTLPDTDDGRAHILEHTVLCGSERYPVRDPFFSMMHRSVATFMNAMTYDDRTVYPFSTTDATDFRNLLDVYLDATFFPRLERLNFLQEGWRTELQDGRCALHGVVLNEMKASYDEPERVLYYGLMRELFGGTTYGVDSGGDPLCIPALSHAALRAFHATHYHPSQAVFMTSGPLDPALVQACIEERVMSRFDSAAPRRLPGLATPWQGPRLATVHVPASQGAGGEEHGLQLAWRFDEAASRDDKARMSALMHLLAGHDGAPIPEAIRASGMGRPSTLMGCDTSTRQVVVHLGVAGLRAEQVEPAKQTLMSVLYTLAQDGMPAQTLEAVLRQKRFAQRKQAPGLGRLLEVVDAGLRSEDLLDALDQEPTLARLGRQMAEPGFVQAQVQKLLACQNRLQLHVLPDEQFAAKRQAAEQAQLDKMTAALTPATRQAMEATTTALRAHQQQTGPGLDVLPRIEPGQLSRKPRPLLELSADSRGVVQAPVSTPGLSQADLVVDASDFALEEAPWLALLVTLLPDMGAAGRPASQALGWRETRVQAFSVSLRSSLQANGRLMVELIYAASALSEHQEGLADVLTAWFAEPDLHDREHLAYLASRSLDERAARMVDSATGMAKLALLAPFSPLADFRARTEGLAALDFWGSLRRQLAKADGPSLLQAQLQRVVQRLQAAPRHWLCASMADDLQALTARCVAAAMPATSTAEPAPALQAADVPDPGAHLALLLPSQVNACFMAWRVPHHNSPDAPALAVAAELLTQQYLLTLVREQGGAYGARAQYDGYMGTFTMGSHADPRVVGTYADYGHALAGVQRDDMAREDLDNAILAVVKELDRPLLPIDEVRQGWKAWRHGASTALRERFRAGVLDCRFEDVRRVLMQHLNLSQCRRAAVVGAPEQALQGLKEVDLMQLAQEAGLLEEAPLPADQPA